MQEVQEKEVANQDPSDLVMARQTSTASRVAERLALLKSVFVRTKTPKMTGIIPGPYRKSNSFFVEKQLFSFDFVSFSLQMDLLFHKRKMVLYPKIN